MIDPYLSTIDQLKDGQFVSHEAKKKTEKYPQKFLRRNQNKYQINHPGKETS